MDYKELICEGMDFDRLITKLSFDIKNAYSDLSKVAFVGVKTRGVPVAELIAKQIKKLTKVACPVGALDISAFRDDKPSGNKEGCCMPFDVKDKHIILVDDVLFTGRTMRAGISGVISFGRPASIKVCVLANRPNYLQMPILAEFVGVSVDTLQDDVVSVSIKNVDKENSIKVYSY